MYLIIFENNEIGVTDELTDEMKTEWDDGYISILTHKDGKFMEWNGEDWEEVESAD